MWVREDSCTEVDTNPRPTCFCVMAYSRERRTGKFCGSVHATISAVKNAAITIPEVPIATKNCEKES